MARATVGLVVAGVLCVPVLAPYVVVRERHPGYRHTEAETLVYSAEPQSYLQPRGGGALSDDLYGELAERFATPNESWEKRLFPGAWVLLASLAGLVVLAIRRFRDSSFALFGLALAVVFFVFSLGPRVGARPNSTYLPFFAFQKLFGGLTRVPARFGIVVPLGLALVAGVGLSRLPRRASTVVAVVSLLFVAAEVAPTTMSVVAAPKVTAAHRAVANREGAVLALPMPAYNNEGSLISVTLAIEAQHLFLSTGHFRPLVNGYAAYHPPSYFEVVQAVQDIPSEHAFEVLKSRDVRTVIVQTNLVVGGFTRWHDVVDRLRAWPGVTEIGSGENVKIFDITGATAAVG